MKLPGRSPRGELEKVPRPREQVILALLFLAATLAVVVSALIIYTLLDGTVDFFTTPSPREDGAATRVGLWEFLTGTEWVPNGRYPKFGVLPLVAGTLLVAGGALLIAGPVGVGGALYLAEFAPRRARTLIKPVIEVLAGIPSIVYGFFALLVISPLLQVYFGASLFNAASAILVVSVMILPLIMSISDDALSSIPQDLREASRALGATEWETATRIVVPAARSGITASVLLALARAIGETMAVTLAAGSVARQVGWDSLSPFKPTQTMTAFIAQTATGDIPPGIGFNAGFAVGFLLFVITYTLNLVAMKAVKRRTKTPKWSMALGRGRYSLAIFLSRLKEGLVGYLPAPRPKAEAQAEASVKSVKPISDEAREAKEAANFVSRYRKALVGKVALIGCLAYALLFLALLLAQVAKLGLGRIDLDFLTNYPSGRLQNNPGIGPVILGSLYLMGLTLLLVLPAGVGAAVYLVEFAPDRRHTRFLRQIIQNLAGVPSIIFGLVGLVVFSRLFDFGLSLLTGSLTLAIMTLPLVVVTAEEALKAVPQGFREASLALGATRWQTVRSHVLPNSVPGIITGAILSLSRALGETAPLLFIASTFSKSAPSSIFDGFMALPITIFYWTRHPKPEFQALAASTILVLLVLLLLMNALAVFIRHRAEARRNW